MFIDLTNKIFGELTTLETVGKNSINNYLWKCRCSCGNERVCSQNSLCRPNGIKSCGCKNIRQDLTGRRFGRLIVLRKDGMNHDHKTTYFCHCDCGQDKVISGRNLIRGKTTSCGCRGQILIGKVKCGSYIEAAIYLKLQQSGIQFKHNLVYPRWDKKSRYDFYIPDAQLFIETSSFDKKTCRWWDSYKNKIDQKKQHAEQVLKQRFIFINRKTTDLELNLVFKKSTKLLGRKPPYVKKGRKLEILTGKRFGKLTVIGQGSRNNLPIWDCICDCGKKRSVMRTYLCNGKIKSCGCQKKSGRKKGGRNDLTGEKRGSLSILRCNNFDANNQPIWSCQCSCGNLENLTHRDLTAHKRQCCHQCSSDKTCKLLDMTNQRYGKLLVLQYFGSGRAGSQWLCRCDCGIEKIISRKSLKGGIKSCGCLSLQQIKTPVPKDELQRTLIDQRKSFKFLAKQYQVDKRTLKKWVKKYGLDLSARKN